MILGFHVSTLLVAGYALLLVAIAVALERLARRSHNLTERFHVAGFSYDAHHDRWQCPAGQHLYRISNDFLARKAVYRAHPHVCNNCHAKPQCTDSDEGRQVERRLDTWLESELRRFQRGFTLLLIGLSGVILVWQMGGPDDFRDRMLLLSLLVPLAAVETHLLPSFLRPSRLEMDRSRRPE